MSRPSGAVLRSFGKYFRKNHNNRGLILANNSTRSRSSILILGACVLIVLLHLWGAIQPSHSNWGVHLYGFYPPLISLAALSFLGFLAIPRIHRAAATAVEKCLSWLSRLPLGASFAITAGILLGGIYLFPAKLHLLGDGAILLRSVPLGINSDEISQSFRNQPLMFWIYKFAMSLHPPAEAPNPYRIYVSIDVAASLLFVALIFWTMRALQRPLFERFLLGCFLFFGAGSQFFFGYVENYVLQYVATAAYALTGWFALEKRISVVIPVALLLLMVLLHLGNLIFLPSVALLIYLRWSHNKMLVLLMLSAAVLTSIGGLSIIGFNIVDITRHISSGSVDFLQLFTAVGGNFPYPMFSLVHLLDWFNASLLIAPFGIVLALILIPAIPSDRRWKHTPLPFLLCTVACGLLFTWVVNSALGIARDWDLFSGFFVPLMVLSVYLIIQPIDLAQRRYVLWLMVLISFLHWAAWIGVNSSADRHLARMQLLHSPRFLSLTTQLSYDEALANFYFDNQQYRDARAYYEHFLRIDSTNPRIIGNAADVYRRLGDRENYFRMLLRAVAINSRDPGIYSNLGVEYAMRGDTAAAIEYNEKAVAMNPGMSKAYANLGILYSSTKNYTVADRYYTKAISLGMWEPVLFRYAGDVCVFLNDYERALKDYDTYLGMVPDDRQVRNVREKVYQKVREHREGKR